MQRVSIGQSVSASKARKSKSSAQGLKICLFSTAAGEDTKSGTGLRVYNLSPTTKGNETRHLEILFGFMYPTTNENVAVLDACFLNPALLKP